MKNNFKPLQPKNNKIKINNYIIPNRGVMLYIEDLDQLSEIPKKYKNHIKDPYKFQSEILEKIALFAKGEEIELIDTGDPIFDELINNKLIIMFSKMDRDYNAYVSKQKAILRNNPNMITANENIVNLILEDPLYKTVKEDIGPSDIKIILAELNAEYDKEQKVELLKKAIEEYSSNKRELINKHAIKATELYKSLNISDYAQVLLYIIKNIY